jgi:hypothetical protein
MQGQVLAKQSLVQVFDIHKQVYQINNIKTEIGTDEFNVKYFKTGNMRKEFLLYPKCTNFRNSYVSSYFWISVRF